MRLGLTVTLFLSGCCCDPAPAAPTLPPAPPPVRNAKAEAAVRLAKDNGWLVAVKYERDTAQATTTPTFRTLSFEVRQAVAADIAAAGMAAKGRAAYTVNLVDTEDRGIGTYSTVLAKLVE